MDGYSSVFFMKILGRSVSLVFIPQMTVLLQLRVFVLWIQLVM